MNTNWYVMRTIPGKEAEAAALMEKKISRKLWDSLRILRKQELFRTKGMYLLSKKEMFPGYIFVHTTSPKELGKELEKSRQFPQLVGGQGIDIVPVEQKDLKFLKNVCGENLGHDMKLSTVQVDDEGQVKSAAGVLKPYLNQITRQRLRHRYVTARVRLFNRQEDVLFGIRMEGDPK